MNFGFVFYFNSILMGIGLAMDAFSVSLADGLGEPAMKKRKMTLIAGTFGFFQGLMPLIGWICIHTIVNMFRNLEKLIPWIALILLAYIGGKMLIEGLRGGDEESRSGLTFGALIVQGIATSIDALSVGFTIADYPLIMALTEAVVICVMTSLISFAGIIIGKTAGTRLSGKAGILGGTILIFIGLEIFVRGVFL